MVDVGWEMRTAGNSLVLLMPTGHQHWGAGSGLEDRLPHFARSSEALKHFWGHRCRCSPCLAMLQAGSACLGRRAQKEGDWGERRCPGAASRLLPFLGAPSKAASKGAWGGLRKGDLGRPLCGIPP